MNPPSSDHGLQQSDMGTGYPLEKALAPSAGAKSWWIGENNDEAVDDNA